MIEPSKRINPPSSLSDLLLRLHPLGLGYLFIYFIGEISQILQIDVQKWLLYVLELLLILHHKERVVHKIIGLCVGWRIFFVVDVQWFTLEEVVV